jgi:hypothetical protein
VWREGQERPWEQAQSNWRLEKAIIGPKESFAYGCIPRNSSFIFILWAQIQLSRSRELFLWLWRRKIVSLFSSLEPFGPHINLLLKSWNKIKIKLRRGFLFSFFWLLFWIISLLLLLLWEKNSTSNNAF